MSSTPQDDSRARERAHLRDDRDAVAAAMAEALRGTYAGWATASASDIGVEDQSGFGGGKAYKLTNRSNPDAPAAMLHILDEYFCSGPGDPLFFDRQRAAHELFAQEGFGPRRIAEDPGKEWFVEEWVGNNLAAEDASVELIEEIARLVAQTHAIDTAWYDDIRRRQCERYPALRESPRGCHIWFYAAFPQHFFSQLSEKLQSLWIHAGPTPATEVGSRLVTTHGDVHRANLVRSGEGLKLVDMEAACVSYAVHDICYCFGTLCATGDLKHAFTRAYLVECGLPASEEDIFALRLDAERCKMATNHFDSIGLWRTVFVRKDEDGNDLGPLYPRLVATADRALSDSALAEDIVTRGFEQCAAVMETLRDGGPPLMGMLVSAHRDKPDPVWRSSMQINWDGTIQTSWERHRALVLGLDDDGQVVLTNCMNRKQRLQLRMRAGGVPVTGLRAPASAAVPLRLTGRRTGQALVISDVTREGFGNDVEFVKVGPEQKALAVHVEPDGVIRLADRPLQAFDCERARTSTGTKVQIFHCHCYDNQKFVLNDDASLSPIGNRDVAWGLAGDELVLVGRADRRAERLTFCDELALAARADGPGTLVVGKPPVCDEGILLELESHPGMALSVGPHEDREDVMGLVLVPAADAERFVVAENDVRLANGGGKIALGTPMRRE